MLKGEKQLKKKTFQMRMSEGTKKTIKDIKKKEERFGLSSLNIEELKTMKDYYFYKSQILYKNSTILMIVAIMFQALALIGFFVRLFFY